MIEMTEMVLSRVARGRGGPGCERNGTSGSRSGRGDSHVELSEAGRGGTRTLSRPREKILGPVLKLL